jgi:hypothetical protein
MRHQPRRPVAMKRASRQLGPHPSESACRRARDAPSRPSTRLARARDRLPESMSSRARLAITTGPRRRSGATSFGIPLADSRSPSWLGSASRTCMWRVCRRAEVGAGFTLWVTTCARICPRHARVGESSSRSSSVFRAAVTAARWLRSTIGGSGPRAPVRSWTEGSREASSPSAIPALKRFDDEGHDDESTCHLTARSRAPGGFRLLLPSQLGR